MKKLLFLLTLLIVTSTVLFADLALPGEFNPVLAKAKFSWKNIKLDIEKTYDKHTQTVTLTATDSKGEKVWTSESLGEEEKLISFLNKNTSLAIRDLDGDGIAEVIAAAKTGLEMSALYVFKFQPETSSFMPMSFTYAREKFSRHFMVADIEFEDNKDILITRKGQIRAAGKIYSESDGPIPGFYYFEPAQGEFVCSNMLTQEEANSKNKKRK